jgi:glycolate oxidase iron-sulfur subunit
LTLEESIDRCIRCGFCLSACPTYRITHDEESSPRGRIALVRAVLADEVKPDLATLATFGECLGCRACESACPAGVVYEEVLLRGREAYVEAGATLPWYARALLFMIRSPWRLRVAQRLWRSCGSGVVRIARLLPTSWPPLALLAALPEPASEPVPARAEANVVIHRGCLMDIFWEGTNLRSVLLLRDAGTRAQLLPPDAGCCGALHAHQGDRETARRLARRVITAFEISGAGTIVSLAGGCGAHLQRYPDLFDPRDYWHARAERFAHAVRDVTSLLAETGYSSETSGELSTYQDSCHLRHGMGVWRQPRELLRAAGPYAEMGSADRCCGSAGIYNLLRPDIAGRILGEKVDEVRAMAPDVVVTSNPGCELQWRKGIRQSGLSVRVCHLVDYLFERRASAE